MLKIIAVLVSLYLLALYFFDWGLGHGGSPESGYFEWFDILYYMSCIVIIFETVGLFIPQQLKYKKWIYLLGILGLIIVLGVGWNIAILTVPVVIANIFFTAIFMFVK